MTRIIFIVQVCVLLQLSYETQWAPWELGGLCRSCSFFAEHFIVFSWNNLFGNWNKPPPPQPSSHSCPLLNTDFPNTPHPSCNLKWIWLLISAEMARKEIVKSESSVCEVKQVQLLGVLKRGLKTECPRQFKLKTPTTGKKKKKEASCLSYKYLSRIRKSPCQGAGCLKRPVVG